jgi:sulfite reductase (NADPH) flavoprotein alpha-component
MTTLALLRALSLMGGEGADAPWLVIAKSVVVVAAFVVFAIAVGRRRKNDDEGAEEASILVVHASQTGVAESLARRTAAAIIEGGKSARLVPLGDLDAAALAGVETALFVVSTTGEGDAPDGAAQFEAREMRAPAALEGLRYALLALGDRSYRDFCGFGRRLDEWLVASGAEPIGDRIDVDRGDEDAIDAWFGRMSALGASAVAAGCFQKWRLDERRQLNPGSDNSPLFHIGLSPLEGAPQWRAGDIAVVSPRNGSAQVDRFLASLHLDPDAQVRLRGEAMPLREALSRVTLPDPAPAQRQTPQQLVDGLKPLPSREYSLASLPSDGLAELVVRQMRGPDGALGVGSGWLTGYAELNGEIEMRLRENRSFHGPADDRPMILIGAGSGIAGLRAHLKERRASGRRRNWLIFGERSREKDFLYQDEILRWSDEGHIRRLDLCFMKEDGVQLYVQDIMREAAQDLQKWIDGGAAVYVCGSRAGLGDGVDGALREILGDERVDALIARGVYRRDVY